ncbi:protein of unknown function (plasmid) [Pararobbsia alpina]
MRRNIGQLRMLLPLYRSWFKGTLLATYWPYGRGQVKSGFPFRQPGARLASLLTGPLIVARDESERAHSSTLFRDDPRFEAVNH